MFNFLNIVPGVTFSAWLQINSLCVSQTAPNYLGVVFHLFSRICRECEEAILYKLFLDLAVSGT